jgi:hypothetical protein
MSKDAGMSKKNRRELLVEAGRFALGGAITPRTQKITSVLSAYWGTGRCAQRGTCVVSHTVV